MFEHLIGNEGNKELLKSTIKNNKVVHSYMFVGQEGIGKSLFAQEFAKSILCSEIQLQNHPDFKVLAPDGNTIKIEQIRNMLKTLYEKPIVSKKKIYIINEAEKMTKESQNALLKTLEEPPEYIVIILIVSNESNILNTIKSRCNKIVFNKIENNILNEYLNKDLNFKEITDNLLKLIDGSIAKAIEVYEQKEIYLNIEDIILNIDKIDIIDLLKKSESIYKNKESIENILKYINVLLLNKAKEDSCNSNKYLNCIDIVQNARKNILRNANYEMNIDNMLFQMFELVKSEE